MKQRRYRSPSPVLPSLGLPPGRPKTEEWEWPVFNFDILVQNVTRDTSESAVDHSVIINTHNTTESADVTMKQQNDEDIEMTDVLNPELRYSSTTSDNELVHSSSSPRDSPQVTTSTESRDDVSVFLAETTSDHGHETAAEEGTYNTVSKKGSRAVENDDVAVSTAITTSTVNNLDSYQAILTELQESIVEDIPCVPQSTISVTSIETNNPTPSIQPSPRPATTPNPPETESPLDTNSSNQSSVAVPFHSTPPATFQVNKTPTARTESINRAQPLATPAHLRNLATKSASATLHTTTAQTAATAPIPIPQRQPRMKLAESLYRAERLRRPRGKIYPRGSSVAPTSSYVKKEFATVVSLGQSKSSVLFAPIPPVPVHHVDFVYMPGHESVATESVDAIRPVQGKADEASVSGDVQVLSDRQSVRKEVVAAQVPSVEVLDESASIEVPVTKSVSKLPNVQPTELLYSYDYTTIENEGEDTWLKLSLIP
jgi:hypothetical protein